MSATFNRKAIMEAAHFMARWRVATARLIASASPKPCATSGSRPGPAPRAVSGTRRACSIARWAYRSVPAPPMRQPGSKPEPSQAFAPLAGFSPLSRAGSSARSPPNSTSTPKGG